MTIAGFQLESATEAAAVASSEDFDRDDTPTLKSEHVHKLLVRTLLNKELHASDQIYLDSEAPMHSLTFLMRESEYVHPAGVELFPFEIIECALSQAGGAIFTHLYRDETADRHRPYRILTSVLNPNDPRRLVLGFFGPEHIISDRDTMDRFADLARTFRLALSSSTEILSALPSGWDSDSPMLLIEKGTGEVVASTPAFDHLTEEFGLSVQESRVDTLLSSSSGLLEGRQLTMRNLESGGCAMSCISLGSRVSSAPRSSGLIESLAEIVLESTEEIQSAVGGSTSRQSLLRTIDTETETIRRTVRRIAMIAALDKLTRHEQSLYRELERAVDRLRPTTQNRVRLVFAGFIDGLHILAPADSIGSLYESILLSHVQQADSVSDTTITFDRHADDRGLSIHFDTTLPSDCTLTGDKPNQHGQFANQLAEKLGIGINTEVRAASNRLVTTLSVNENKRIRS